MAADDEPEDCVEEVTEEQEEAGEKIPPVSEEQHEALDRLVEATAKRKGKKEKAKPEETAAAKKEEAPAEVAEPAGPEMPSMKMSQILPMVVMLGLQKFDLEELGYKHHAEILFIIVQLLCLGMLFHIKQKVDAMEDGGKKIVVPEVKQMGQVTAAATEQTPKEYDGVKWFEQAKQAVISFFILGGVYYKWGYLMPLVLQVLMTPVQLYESNLFQIHIMKSKTMKRPFPVPNAFGLPSMPEMPSEEVKEVKDEKKKA